MRGLSIFWIIYMLFFAIPFPMWIYYSTKDDSLSNLMGENPWYPLSMLALSVLLWAILLIGYYQKWVIRTFSIKRNIEKLKTTGEPREAKILESSKIDKRGAAYDTYELMLQFKNLRGSTIMHKTTVNDTKPYERRYETGKTVGILLDKEVNKVPYFIFATTEVSIKKMHLFLSNLAWLALTSIVVWYYIYSYDLESRGMGWRFMGIGHPLLTCAFTLLVYRVFGTFIAHKFTGKPSQLYLIKFKGTHTTARVLKVSQSGTYINEQPMINFELEFTDDFNHKHRASIKKIVDLLDLDSVRQEYYSIFYLKEDPQKIAFEKDLNELKGEF
ncbi:hypothetical protein [Pedobacter zeae]|uniref:Uncharacterized protein n=1 Tax=Pedobacter zeae TaxID=1737356 RepID=A0A7W6P5B6_9SPHI|nr:hypothetical protein [Pedobacter zeae]MBB4107648.1 hypothetical protein [Pedobacter zeae]GGG97961.1 hypothetical protein GCM10007422_10010 [Pedobacter zeae]